MAPLSMSGRRMAPLTSRNCRRTAPRRTRMPTSKSGSLMAPLATSGRRTAPLASAPTAVAAEADGPPDAPSNADGSTGSGDPHHPSGFSNSATGKSPPHCPLPCAAPSALCRCASCHCCG